MNPFHGSPRLCPETREWLAPRPCGRPPAGAVLQWPPRRPPVWSAPGCGRRRQIPALINPANRAGNTDRAQWAFWQPVQPLRWYSQSIMRVIRGESEASTELNGVPLLLGRGLTTKLIGRSGLQQRAAAQNQDGDPGREQRLVRPTHSYRAPF